MVESWTGPDHLDLNANLDYSQELKGFLGSAFAVYIACWHHVEYSSEGSDKSLGTG